MKARSRSHQARTGQGAARVGLSSNGVDAVAVAGAFERFGALEGKELRGEERRVDMVVVGASLVVKVLLTICFRPRTISRGVMVLVAVGSQSVDESVRDDDGKNPL